MTALSEILEKKVASAAKTDLTQHAVLSRGLNIDINANELHLYRTDGKEPSLQEGKACANALSWRAYTMDWLEGKPRILVVKRSHEATLFGQ